MVLMIQPLTNGLLRRLSEIIENTGSWVRMTGDYRSAALLYFLLLFLLFLFRQGVL